MTIIISPTATNNCLTAYMNLHNSSKIWIKFYRSCLKQNEIAFSHRNVVNLYFVYEITLAVWSKHWIYSRKLFIWSF